MAKSPLFAGSGHPDKVKKKRNCLGCGKKMWTDRCHRKCKKCERREEASPTGRKNYYVDLPDANRSFDDGRDFADN